jgi:DNA-binding transcriptional regulator YhcF (GntR family)
VDEEAPGTNGPRPPYLHIADALRDEILDGRYPVGQRIPSQAELEERFRVSRPTVQRALGVLREEGYIDNQRGRPSEVLPWQADPPHPEYEVPEPAFTALATHIDEAFNEPDIVIDSFSLTTETLLPALIAQLQRVQRGELHPASITVRLMLPSQDARLAIPRLVADASDERPLRRLRQLVRGQTVTLRSAFQQLSQLRTDVELSVEFKTVPITPVQKLYVVNKHTALVSYYTVVPREVPFGSRGDKGEIFDVLGVDAVLFAFRRDPARPEAHDSQFVTQSQGWFDSLWSTIAEPMTLFE